MLEPTTVYTPSPTRYDSMTYNHVGASGLTSSGFARFLA